MSTDVIATFEDELAESATVVRTTAGEFPELLDDHVRKPAVGVELPFEGVSLPEGVGPPETASELRAATTGITPAGMGIARYGTVTVRSDDEGAELVSLYPERHVAVLPASTVVADAETAFERIAEEFDAGHRTQVLASGPSVTADMGGLVEGVHGPTEVVVVVLEDR